jgi:glycosyltransferase involved in cell wall biosynthesis
VEAIAAVMADFSVVIPTYNGEKRLPKLLESLRSQLQTESLSWDIIVVDNNSQDNTAKLIQSLQKNWPSNVPLRYILESQQGAAFARQRGLKEADSDLIGFIDDDNIVASDWIFQAYHFAQTYPQTGAFGGRIHVEFETPPPENFNTIAGFFSARDRGDSPNRYQPELLSLPTAAAMVVRKSVWLDCFKKPSLFQGRVGQSMVGGEDWEPLMWMHKAGWEIWYNPKMHAYHHVPAWRLERDYLRALIHGACLSFFPLKMIVSRPQQQGLILARTTLGNLYRIIRHWLKYRDKVNTDLVAACEFQIYWSRIASVFYYFKLKGQKP